MLTPLFHDHPFALITESYDYDVVARILE